MPLTPMHGNALSTTFFVDYPTLSGRDGLQVSSGVDWQAAFLTLNPSWDRKRFDHQHLQWHQLGVTPPGVGGQVSGCAALSFGV